MLPAVLGSGPPALALCACACASAFALAPAPRKAPQEALEASKREPRRGQNPPPRGPKGLPSWAPGRPQVATKAALRPPLGGSWGALGALLGSSWDLLGRSRPLLGRSWGSLWPPGGAIFAFFTCFFGGLARGLEKNDGFVVFVVFFVCCFGSLFEPLVPSSRRPRQAREH